jgi:hypothetical protein
MAPARRATGTAHRAAGKRNIRAGRHVRDIADGPAGSARAGHGEGPVAKA